MSNKYVSALAPKGSASKWAPWALEGVPGIVGLESDADDGASGSGNPWTGKGMGVEGLRRGGVWRHCGGTIFG